MTRSIFLSIVFHSAMIFLTALSLPFMMRSPIDLPPILSVELIQITDTTSIPFAAKAAKTLEKIKKKQEEREKKAEKKKQTKKTKKKKKKKKKKKNNKKKDSEL